MKTCKSGRVLKNRISATMAIRGEHDRRNTRVAVFTASAHLTDAANGLSEYYRMPSHMWLMRL